MVNLCNEGVGWTFFPFWQAVTQVSDWLRRLSFTTKGTLCSLGAFFPMVKGHKNWKKLLRPHQKSLTNSMSFNLTSQKSKTGKTLSLLSSEAPILFISFSLSSGVLRNQIVGGQGQISRAIIDLPGGQINDPSSWKYVLFSSVPPSNSLVSV